MERFTLTQQHVDLLRRMNVRWEDDAYDGAPAIDAKRPYGNSDVWRDVAEIIGLAPTVDDEGETHWPQGTRDQCMALHRETEKALQVCLTAGTFKPGEYVADSYRRNWRRV
jgi:hypothetical protein